MTAPSSPSNDKALWRERWQSFSSTAVAGFHAYANWLVSISWRRFFVLALGLLILVGIVHDMPPFTWRITEEVEVPHRAPRSPAPPKPPVAPKAAVPPAQPVPPKSTGKDFPIRIEKGSANEGVDISIGKDGIHITPKPGSTTPGPESAASAAEASAQAAADAASAVERSIRIVVPKGTAEADVRAAVEAARAQIEESVRDAKEAAEQAAAEAAEARRDAEAAIEELRSEERQFRTKTTRVGIGDFLMQLTTLLVVASAIIKYTYKGTKQAEVKAAQATETAEAESLKRQVVEARMAAMQAQVEPHFLFNTLASIDHLIETDPARASVMQKNLIALLRASMPTMREAAGSGQSVRDLGREIAVIRPYLEILKVRMEERLTTDIAVPEGLMSAEFPPMMIQTLVENAIKHGLEPKAEGGHLRVAAEIVHGKLQMTVADTGLGFGKAATAGTGVGLANIRERLQMLYGAKASLTVAENQPSGTVVTVTVPYKSIEPTA
jgi:Histidine kinase/Histidine kinase-, DNA gyrase B-, and HSP90-like ATPase